MAMASCGPSNHELASLASHGAIQSDAPIKATSSIIIDAPEKRIWQVLVNVRARPHWQAGVDKVDGAAMLSTGAAFSWETDGTTIHAQVALSSPPDRIAWTGRAATARAIHIIVLTRLDKNRTKVESMESMDGLLLPWFYDSAKLQKSEDVMLKQLAAATYTETR